MEYIKCNQEGCDNPAHRKFTWPGRDEAYICEEHLEDLITIANAMGLRSLNLSHPINQNPEKSDSE